MQPYLPMLAVSAEPFDSPEYLFEVKWNGVRALAVNEPKGGGCGARARGVPRALPGAGRSAALPSGTVLDGEVVQLSQGRPDFDGLLARPSSAARSAVRWHSRQQPVNYVVFDVLRAAGRCVLGQTLEAGAGERWCTIWRNRACRFRQAWSARAVVVHARGAAGPGRRHGETPQQPLSARTAVLGGRRSNRSGSCPVPL